MREVVDWVSSLQTHCVFLVVFVNLCVQLLCNCRTAPTSHVVTQSTNAFLLALSTVSCSSKKCVWHILGLSNVLWNDMSIWGKSLFLNWVLLDVHFQIHLLTLLETALSLYHLSCILYAHHWSLRHLTSVVVGASFSSDALTWGVAIVAFLSDVGLWFSTNVTEILVWIWNLLIVRQNWSISVFWEFGFCLTHLVLKILPSLSLLSQSILVVWIV